MNGGWRPPVICGVGDDMVVQEGEGGETALLSMQFVSVIAVFIVYESIDSQYLITNIDYVRNQIL